MIHFLSVLKRGFGTPLWWQHQKSSSSKICGNRQQGVCHYKTPKDLLQTCLWWLRPAAEMFCLLLERLWYSTCCCSSFCLLSFGYCMFSYIWNCFEIIYYLVLNMDCKTTWNINFLFLFIQMYLKPLLMILQQSHFSLRKQGPSTWGS